MAITGTLKPERHYVLKDGLLYLHFPSCHAAYAEHCRRTGYEGEVPDRKALRRQIRENHRQGGYVKELNALVNLGSSGNRCRAVVIDLEEIKSCLTVDDFPSASFENLGRYPDE